MQAATLAAHRYGYAEPDLARVAGDPRGWVLAQFDKPAPLDTSGLLGGAAALRAGRELQMSAQQPDAADRKRRRDALRRANLDALQRRWQHAATTPTPVVERWVHFWSNHCCVAATKAVLAGLVWPHENEAIRPHALGRFSDLLQSSTLHPAMLLYLDNAASVGPASRAGLRRDRGLNENLARELLELHTLGADGGYTQADVTETARLLTGWTARADAPGGATFVDAAHEPGPKRVLGRQYPAGPQAVVMLLDDLSRHPATSRHLATKLVRHFVADDPPPALVAAVAARWRATDGDLLATARALFGNDLAWRGDARAKFKRPDELLISTHRMLGVAVPEGNALTPSVQAMQAMGQPVGRAPSPQGWPDRSDDWLSPDSLFKRVTWADRYAAGHADAVDARRLASSAMGADLGEVDPTPDRPCGQRSAGAGAVARESRIPVEVTA